MHPEFKAYVKAICNTADQVQAARVTRNSDRGVEPFANTTKSFFTVIADFLAELPPYYCELKMVPGVKRIPPRRSSPRDAIGYHGLV
jgi:hypothetical protein